MRQRPSVRTKYRFDPPPKDGSEIVVAQTVILNVYWDRELKTWIVARPVRIETLDDVTRWRKP